MSKTYKNVIAFVWVKNMDRAKAFYTKTLGMNIVLESDGWVEMAVPGTGNAYLALNQWKEDKQIPTNEFVTLGVEKLDDFHSALIADDVHMKGEVVDFPDQGMKMFKFMDPDGNVITAASVE
ncbi:MAG: VOC family protein [Spirochaetales bacterium]|nr:VOC family protein [Spirochaetales bacterium]